MQSFVFLPLLSPCSADPSGHDAVPRASPSLSPRLPPPADKEATLLAEVDAFGRHRAAGPQDLAAFPYAHAALQEALRIYPPAHTAIREAPAGIQLGGLDIPGDAALQVGGAGRGRLLGS